MMARRHFSVFATLLALIVLGGCDRGPSGEGDWRVTIEGPAGPFGAAAVVVSGEGVLDVTSADGTRVWSREAADGSIRAVIIQPSASGEVAFRIRVRDLSEPTPSVALVELADLSDEPVTVSSDHRLRFRR
jgi:hypothetical protein